MPRDSSDYLRAAVISAWRDDAAITAFVADRVYPPQRPPNAEWPFAAYGVPTVAPFLASCMDGSTVTFAGHAYAETTGEGASTTQGEPHARAIAAAMVSALPEQLDLEPFGCPYPAVAYVTWTGTQVIQDDNEADRWHSIASFDVSISS